MKEIITILREYLNNNPFQPFEIVTFSGHKYTVKDPDLVVPMQHVMFYAHGKADKHAFIKLQEIIAIETLETAA